MPSQLLFRFVICILPKKQANYRLAVVKKKKKRNHQLCFTLDFQVMGQNEAPGFFIKVAYYSYITICLNHYLNKIIHWSQFTRHWSSIGWFYLYLPNLFVHQVLSSLWLLLLAYIQPGTQCTSRFPDIVGKRLSDDKSRAYSSRRNLTELLSGLVHAIHARFVCGDTWGQHAVIYYIYMYR